MEYPIEKLGAIAPLSPKQKNQIPATPAQYDIEKDGFQRVPPSKKSIYRQALIAREKGTENIKAFIDGFDEPNN